MLACGEHGVVHRMVPVGLRETLVTRAGSYDSPRYFRRGRPNLALALIRRYLHPANHLRGLIKTDRREVGGVKDESEHKLHASVDLESGVVTRIEPSLTVAGASCRARPEDRNAMKTLVYGGPGLKNWRTDPYRNWRRPKPSSRQRATICGTDRHVLKGDVPNCAPQRILGHEGAAFTQP